ncbi:MAG: cytochrome c-type biogenesis protein [Acidimicrobiales bacterium]
MTAPLSQGTAGKSPRVPWWIPWGALVLVVAVLLGVGARPRHTPSLNERTDRVARTIKCPACTDESVATSDAPISQAARQDIHDKLQAGESPDQIRAYFVNLYGRRILLTPRSSGVDSLVWILPVVVLLLGACGLAFAFWRWRRRSDDEVSDEDRELVAEAMDGQDVST